MVHGLACSIELSMHIGCWESMKNMFESSPNFSSTSHNSMKHHCKTLTMNYLFYNIYTLNKTHNSKNKPFKFSQTLVASGYENMEHVTVKIRAF